MVEVEVEVGVEVVVVGIGDSMELIEQSHRIIGRCPSDPQEALKLIEYAGRVCYASEDKITEDSALPFVRGLIERGHLSVLEHSEFTGDCDGAFTVTPYLHEAWGELYPLSIYSGNLRAWMESGNRPKTRGHGYNDVTIDSFLRGEFMPAVCPQEHRRYTVEFITNRAMTHELVRHRTASVSQASQRYIRYGDENQMLFIKPFEFSEWGLSAQDRFKDSCRSAEYDYGMLLAGGLKPQQARNVLPNSCATRIVMTADRTCWEHVFKLRCDKAADPQMQDLMMPVKAEMMKLWEDEG